MLFSSGNISLNKLLVFFESDLELNFHSGAALGGSAGFVRIGLMVSRFASKGLEVTSETGWVGWTGSVGVSGSLSGTRSESSSCVELDSVTG